MPAPKDPEKYDEWIRKQREAAKERFKNKENHPMFGKTHSEKTKKVMSENRKGRIMKPETRRKIGEATKKRLETFHHLRGVKPSEESNKKRSESVKKWFLNNPHPMRGKHHKTKRKPLTMEERMKIGERKRGTKHSEFTRMKMSKAHIGKNTWSRGRPSPLKGIPLKPEHIAKLTASRRYRIIPRKDTNPERIMQIALSLNGIKFEKHKPILGQPDIFIEPNICIFVDGDYWHANPIKYSPESQITKRKKAKEIWARDSYVTHELSKLGYTIIRLWESDIKKNTQGCVESIIKMIKEGVGVV